MYPNTYEKIIYQLCDKHQINIQKIDGESIYRLAKNNFVHYIWSRRFDINSTIASRIADNKYATYLVLKSLSIPIIPCIKLPRIDTKEYPNLEISIFEICQNLLLESSHIVIKPNNSYEGIDVYKCSSLKDVEQNILQIANKYKYLVASPYIDAIAEYRLFYLDNQILYAYKKNQEKIICDGTSTVIELLLNNKTNLNTVSKDIMCQFDKIYPKGNELKLNWKFNLSQGGDCVPITDDNLYKKLVNIAISAANAINIRFATIDILVDQDNNMQVLEINAGVAMDQFIIKYPNGKEIATSIYEKAIIAMFE